MAESAEKCKTCGGLGLVTAVDYNVVIRCPDCYTTYFFQDCRKLGIPPDQEVEITGCDVDSSDRKRISG